MQLDLWRGSDGDVALCLSTETGVTGARAHSTRAAYQTDWRLFERWCLEHGLLALPASGDTLARYLGHLWSSGRKASTIRRARISIGLVHREQGLQRPDGDEQVRTLERSFAAGESAAEKSAPPLLKADLERMVSALGNTRRDERDRALLLLGFAGAFRSCELVALNASDITRMTYGYRVSVRHRASPLVLSLSRSLLCPVPALERWLSRLPSTSGPLFRTVYGARVTEERLAPRAVSRAVQRAAARAQLATEYSSHSLRSGSIASRARFVSTHNSQVCARRKAAV